MSLFVVHHTHSAETCPAADRQMAPMLLTHLSRENARKFGVTIQSEAVIDGGHALYLIVEARDQESVKNYMQPFAQAGTLSVMPASLCEVVVNRGAC
jgi:Domain of unknown function (DUF3303)